MKFPARFLVFTALASAALYAPACDEHDDDDHTHPAATTPDTSITDVVFLEEGGDEALQVMLAAKSTADPARAAAFTSPADGAALPGATPHTFTWAPPKTSLRAPLRGQPGRAPAPRLFGPPASAFAHGTPVNGAGFFIVFSAAGNDRLLRVFTTKTSYQPDAAAWAKLTGAQGPIKAEITSATFDNNNLAPGGGPYTSAAISFTVTP